MEENERNWPPDLPDPKTLYADFYNKIHDLLYNIVCASCGCIGHDRSDYTLVSVLDQRLSCLKVESRTLVPYDFSCGISALDEQNIMIDRLGIQQEDSDSNLWLCSICHPSIMLSKRPAESLANFRWVGPMPDELKDLTWIEELLIARAHVVGRVVRLQARNQASYFGVKGHIILLPQDTTLLLDLLPMTPASLPDVVRVVWTGKSAPDRDRLRSQFTVRRDVVYNALQWLCRHNEDYRQVTIDHQQFAKWPPVFVTTSLLDSIGRSRDFTDEDISRSGFATEDIDTADHDGDLPLTTSAILDTSEVSISPDIATLRRLAELKNEVTVNVVTGSTPLIERDNPSYFTSAFPTIFLWGTAKHIHPKRDDNLSLNTWIKLMLRHSSR